MIAVAISLSLLAIKRKKLPNLRPMKCYRLINAYKRLLSFICLDQWFPTWGKLPPAGVIWDFSGVTSLRQFFGETR